jgi:dihydrofolate reductase
VRTALIVAMTRRGLMGRGNALPWNWPEDLKHFKRTTRGHAVVMGRRTFESLQENFGGPLPQRDNFVVSRGAGAAPEGEARDGARWFRSLDAALAALARRAPAAATPGESGSASDAALDGSPDEVFILGGAEIFALALKDTGALPQRLVVTWVPEVPAKPGDTFFPHSPPEAWILQHYDAARRWHDNDGALEFVIYTRKGRGAS